MRTRLIAALVAAALPWAAYGQDLPKPKPTPKDLYVACYLFAHDTDVPRGSDGYAVSFSAAQCGLAAIAMIANREGDRPDTKYKFCLDDGAAVRTDPAKAMAYAYLDYYESHVFRTPQTDGPAMYLVAMIERWPCPVRK